MVIDHETFLKTVRNHLEFRKLLQGLAGSRTLSWFDCAPLEMGRTWYALARTHLLSARHLLRDPRLRRSAVSRSYYAAYSASRCVRYLTSGFVKLDSDDHKCVGDLPADFPEKSSWASFLLDLRRDRNAADYEPWKTLTFEPTEAVTRTGQFLTKCRRYLTKKGIRL